MFWLHRCSSSVCTYINPILQDIRTFVQKLDNVWQCKYEVTDFLDNSLQALTSRLLYVQ